MSEFKTLGVIGSAFKENERRLPLHPEHFSQINEKLRPHIFFEDGYGQPFGIDDSTLKEGFAGTMPRAALFEKCDIVLLPKPTEQDFAFFRDGLVVWGWPHCVQGEPITQQAIDKKMTFIAWEAMHGYHRDGSWAYHTFHKNNEMAGYCSVLHALSLAGFTGHYGNPTRKAAVISFGSTARGAVHALTGLGFSDITVFTQRAVQAVTTQIPGLHYLEYTDPDGSGKNLEIYDHITDTNHESFADKLCEFDVIVNCILQDTDKPLMFIDEDHVNKLKPLSVVIDVSCDLGMGFAFARPTSFEEPAFEVGRKVLYYAVDHTPSYLWESATFDISLALLPYLEAVMRGPEEWKKDLTIQRSIEIQDGKVLNSKILSFQNRSEEYPHQIREYAESKKG
ncbi:MAG: N(5)-(carboxyethyl)ornithine synthase [Candidatus Eremiobacteraeota bacterium]|nr:N(5)-(carboxyethyl)ornithine synthase [Candidatus Eremiobacteraeota bacterium]